MSAVQFSRVWAMPDRRTFSIKPIRALLAEVMGGRDHPDRGVWLDPFANESRLAEVTNDLNPDFETNFNMDALPLAGHLQREHGGTEKFNLLWDPPYSVRQVAECYAGVGLQVTAELTRSSFYSDLKNAYAPLIKPGGLVVCFGWSSNGFGIGRGFALERVLMVAHGGAHNDTIITVERKMQTTLHTWAAVA